jgi:hypothetical protein
LLSWRHSGGSAADWPALWPTRADPLAGADRALTPKHPGRAVTICTIRNVRSGQPATEISEWRDLAEAIEAAATLFDRPCATTCPGQHSIVYTDEHGAHVRSMRSRTPPPDRAEELAAAYPPKRNGHATLATTRSSGRSRPC